MKKYKVMFSERAKRQLKKMDKHICTLIIGWVDKNLENCTNPRIIGKGLTANRSRTVEI